ncbi:hypothetical protein [Burkholderia seminalis]|uniref:hypothetical protein n=1 Tax=Burkholderia seminalis TaxID=488731 RepID=UPI0026521E16|nr:hypothetical protein [Burkholderia seminalis]MDN7592065.1 hypothetical protein [Burkholderia seminalis]
MAQKIENVRLIRISHFSKCVILLCIIFPFLIERWPFISIALIDLIKFPLTKIFGDGDSGFRYFLNGSMAKSIYVGSGIFMFLVCLASNIAALFSLTIGGCRVTRGPTVAELELARKSELSLLRSKIIARLVAYLIIPVFSLCLAFAWFNCVFGWIQFNVNDVFMLTLTSMAFGLPGSLTVALLFVPIEYLMADIATLSNVGRK